MKLRGLSPSAGSQAQQGRVRLLFKRKNTTETPNTTTSSLLGFESVFVWVGVCLFVCLFLLQREERKGKEQPHVWGWFQDEGIPKWVLFCALNACAQGRGKNGHFLAENFNEKALKAQLYHCPPADLQSLSLPLRFVEKLRLHGVVNTFTCSTTVGLGFCDTSFAKLRRSEVFSKCLWWFLSAW